MSQSLNILMAQINPTVGAIEANAEKIAAIIKAHQHEQDVIIFPELVLSGYPPEDLLLRPELYQRIHDALKNLQVLTEDCFVIIGHPWLEKTGCYNAASVFHRGKRFAIYHKQKLPNYGIFDEQRYFKTGEATACILPIKGYRLGLCICEDLWQKGPVEQVLNAGADGLLCLNASPFDKEKPAIREELLRNHSKRGLTIIYVNLVGGQDELVFDGQSLAFDSQGTLCARATAFQEELVSLTLEGKTLSGKIAPTLPLDELLYKAIVCGTKDYVEKNGFPGVLIGLSGGIDSALTLAIAVDALGASRVHAVMMPSRYSATISLEDAQQQLNIMGVESTILSIEPAFNCFLETLAPSFKGLATDSTEENIQARIRGILLMALSNKTGKMVLTTSNKSETAVGYATLYGDMAGGFAVLKDLLKTEVYQLATYRNRLSEVIPQRVIIRAPSAELAENQCDQDSLPDYPTLDAIIRAYMEKNQSAAEIIAAGFAPEVVHRIVHLIKRNEYKRRQAAPGVKISTRVFGKDWRLPITSGF